MVGLDHLGDCTGSPIHLTSSTGASNLFGDLSKDVRGGIENDSVTAILKEWI
jgi:hypothetical protein